ncbi:MAG: undecaprenyl-diphosphate phosphatase [Bacteroidia bacterium]|nr:undecaprenyl-diphosphate phosphatase [Bacteroidia bacterium]MCZ2247718.1 undecaprenyl-diphosphate phosphatase [Bacteroidia bacterium]
MTIIHALILAIIEGLTEFLPVSSTGHLIIATSIMGLIQDPATKEFTNFFVICIQLGCILSVMVLYWRDFLLNSNFYLKLFLAFIPAPIFYFLFKKSIDSFLENALTVAVSLVVGGIVLLFVDKWFNADEDEGEELDNKKAIKIGLFQALAMIPGVSRSAATIIGGLSQKLSRKKAAEFSFILAVPTIFAATIYKFYKFIDEGNGFESNQVHLLVVGNIVAFIVGVLAIKYFISYITKHGFKLFGYYRIFVGLLIIILHFMGIKLGML